MTPEEIKLAMKNRVSIPPDKVSEASLRDAGCLDRVCVLPEQFNERVSYLGDLLVQMLTRVKCDDELRIMVGKLCCALSYALNSSSWRDWELHAFDLDEIRRKIGRFEAPQRIT